MTNITTSTPPKVYIDGHNVKRGYVVQREFSELPPKHYNKSIHWVRRLVERYNRMYAPKAPVVTEDCFVVPGERIQYIDRVIKHPDGTLRGQFSGQTFNEIAARYWKPIKMIQLAEYQRMHAEQLRTKPSEITEQEFIEALECLPPMNWGTWDGVESFRISEFYSGTITSIYARVGGQFFVFKDDAYMDGGEVARKVLAVANAGGVAA